MLSADGPDRNVLKFKSPMCFNMSDADLLVEKLEVVLTELEDDDSVTERAAENMAGSANAPVQNGHTSEHHSQS